MLHPPLEPFAPSAAAYAALADLLCRAWPENPTCAAWLSRFDAQRDPARPLRREAVRHGDDPQRLVAVVEWSLHPQLADPDRFQLSVAVDPAHGGRGLGTALLQRALSALPADRPIRVECETSEDRPWAVRLLDRHGFRQTLRSVTSELELARFDPDAFGEAARQVEARGLRLRPLGRDGALDERLLRSLHALQAAVVRDVPGVDAEMGVPFEIWRAAYRDNPDLLPEAQLLALDGDAVVGMTQLWASQATDQLLFTGFTGVVRSHRRLGLATALKVRSLAWCRGLRTTAGPPPRVRTSNAETNPMLGINLRLGFVERPAQLRLELLRPAGA
jgi:GNAT superfamily N-acetyltransferase